MSTTKSSEMFWTVESEWCRDPETQAPLCRRFDNESSAMDFAAAKSMEHLPRRIRVDVKCHDSSQSFPVAQYIHGVEQFEKAAFKKIELACKAFAICREKSGINPFLMLIALAAFTVGWAYGVSRVANWIGGDSGLIIAFLVVTPAIAAIAVVVNKTAQKERDKYAVESRKWVRQIAYEVMTIEPVLRGRILKTHSREPLHRYSNEMSEVAEELQGERSGLED